MWLRFSELDIRPSQTITALYFPTMTCPVKKKIKGFEPTEKGEMHVTITYVPDMKEATWHKCHEALTLMFANFPAFKGKLHGGGVFTPKDKEADVPVYLNVQFPELEELKHKSDKVLKALGIEPSNDYGFTPHCTLGYAKNRDVAYEVLKTLEHPHIPLEIDGFYIGRGGEWLKIPFKCS